MKTNCQDRAELACSEDLRIIQVELPSDCAGVAAALRRAFAGAVPRPSEGEFDALLRQLN